jgi:TPR repeat protein
MPLNGRPAQKIVRPAVIPFPAIPSEPPAPPPPESLRPRGSPGRIARPLDLATIAANRTTWIAALALIVVVAAAWFGTAHFGAAEPNAGGSHREESEGATAKAGEPTSVGGAGASLAAVPTAPTPRDRAATLARLRAEAERGDAIAQNDLGLLYATGRDVPLDEREAVKWFERAAGQGAVNAQFNLGVMYHRGGGVTADATQAVAWYRLAAERDHPLAQHNLATLYSKGEGIDQDYAAAAQWLTRAAEAGIAASQYRLGQLYESGLGVAKDPAAARAWYARAAAQGHERAQESERRMTSDETTPASVTVSRENIRETQRLLARLNFQPGAADGNLGPQTERAIRDYQREAGLPITGITSPDLVASLKVRDSVRETQRLLSRLSFQPGAADGRAGPQTERAIRDFQRAAGLKVTGVASPELLEELRQVARSMGR